MDARDALDLTIRVYKLKATDIARDSNVNPAMLSRYRNKKQDLQASNAFEIIKSMPQEARDYFYDLLDGKQVCVPTSK